MRRERETERGERERERGERDREREREERERGERETERERKRESEQGPVVFICCKSLAAFSLDSGENLRALRPVAKRERERAVFILRATKNKWSDLTGVAA